MDEASSAQAANPASAKRLNAACSVTGSGVVRPVKSTAPGSPTPSVPITPLRRPRDVSACAIHQAVEVLPLVPVVATTSSRLPGWPKKSCAMAPVAAFRPGSTAMRASSKPKASMPSASTRHVVAPASSAAATKRRPSFA